MNGNQLGYRKLKRIVFKVSLVSVYKIFVFFTYFLQLAPIEDIRLKKFYLSQKIVDQRLLSCLVNRFEKRDEKMTKKISNKNIHPEKNLKLSQYTMSKQIFNQRSNTIVYLEYLLTSIT
jgi:hypothetical protein